MAEVCCRFECDSLNAKVLPYGVVALLLKIRLEKASQNFPLLVAVKNGMILVRSKTFPLKEPPNASHYQ